MKERGGRKRWREDESRERERERDPSPSASIISPTRIFLRIMSVILKVAFQILGGKFYKNTKKSSLYSQSLLILIHRTSVVERHPIRRAIRDLLWPMSPTCLFLHE